MNDSDWIGVTIDRARHTVLVVDDNAVTRYATARLLRAAQFQTTEAGSGTEALAAAERGVSAVVLDVHLPDIDGFEVCRTLRSRPATASLPIVHLSAERMRDADRVAGLNAGADAYLVHPVDPAVLVANLQALIRARTAEDELRRSEQRFRAIYDQAHSGIALVDAQGRFADVNPEMARLLGRPREELVGRAVTEFAPPEAATEVADRMEVLARSGASWRGEFPLAHREGGTVHLEWSVSPPIDPGVRVAIAIDASERHELDRQRHDVLEREQAARVVAERHSRTKDDFIAVLSHELRTPLNAIVGWVHILRRRGVSPEALQGLEAIDRNVKTQARIISDILDVSRINSGKLRLERQLVDPQELVAASIDSLRPAIENRQIQVEADLSGASGAVWLDPARYQQVFWNLMTNAIKFSPHGGRIVVTLVQRDGRLTLAVRDFGPGIDPEFLPQLFDRFSQSTSPRNRSHGGLGLGLSIVQHLVELHGGFVEAVNAGPGTLMRVDLPLEEAPASPQAPAAGDAPALVTPAEVSLAGLDVLLVEDDADAVAMMTVVLTERGAAVRAATNFDAAMEQARAAWPGVVVSDIGLPGRDGFELALALRQHEQLAGLPRLPMIALTAFTRPEDRARSAEVGFDEHLAKPLRPHALLEAIQRLWEA